MDILSILYVEDNADLRENIVFLMEAADREIVACASAEEGLALAESRPFDLVVTDVSLPGMSGTELVRRLLRANPQRWIALCSGFDFGQAIEQLGVNVRALQKPFEFEELDELIAEVRAARNAPV